MELSASRTPTIYAVVSVFWPLCLVAIAVRFFARYVSRTRFGWDDWCILAAGLFVLPAGALEYGQISLGVGKHVNYLVATHPSSKAISDLELLGKLIFTDEIIYGPLICFIKCSIINFYIRLFGIRPSFLRVCYALIAITIAWAIMVVFLSLFQCMPLENVWVLPVSRSKCIITISGYALAIQLPNVVLDLAILVTPWYSIWQLKLPLVKRFIVAAILLLGASGIAFSIVRLVVTIPLHLDDFTWYYFDTIIWSTVEICLGISCACLPVMGPLLPRCWLARSNPDRIGDPTRFIRSGVSRTAIESKRRFDRLADDNIEFLETGDMGGIKMTTEITIQHEIDIMALKRLDEGLGFAI